jgi:hypothetical protein
MYLNLKIPSVFFVAALYLSFTPRALKIADQLPVIMIPYDWRPVKYSPQNRNKSGGNEDKKTTQQITRFEPHSNLNGNQRRKPVKDGASIHHSPLRRLIGHSHQWLCERRRTTTARLINK